MHEVSLGQTIRDYLTGEHVDRTTYEDLRQALARMLVEERGYPAAALRSKVSVRFPVVAASSGEAEEYCRTVDVAAYAEDGTPLLILLFCPGQVNTYRRESLAAARLFPGGPVPLVLVTDTRDAILVGVQEDVVLGEGMRAVPPWKELAALVRAHPVHPLSPERAEGERRILHTYSEFIKTCCDASVCML